jgi:hypothetical protein
VQEAKQIGEDYLQLEKYANLNYMVRTLTRGGAAAARAAAAASQQQQQQQHCM